MRLHHDKLSKLIFPFKLYTDVSDDLQAYKSTTDYVTRGFNNHYLSRTSDNIILKYSVVPKHPNPSHTYGDTVARHHPRCTAWAKSGHMHLLSGFPQHHSRETTANGVRHISESLAG